MNHMSHHGWDVSLDPHTVPVFLWLQWAHRRSLQPMQPTLARTCAVQRRIRPAGHPAQRRTGLHPHPFAIAGTDAADLRRLEQGDGATGSARAARLCRDDDRRIKPVRLTTDGQALIEQAMADAVVKVAGAPAAHGAEWGRTDPTGRVCCSGWRRQTSRTRMRRQRAQALSDILPWRSPSHTTPPPRPARSTTPG